MEREACGLKQQSSSDHLNELQHILGSHKVCELYVSLLRTRLIYFVEGQEGFVTGWQIIS